MFEFIAPRRVTRDQSPVALPMNSNPSAENAEPQTETLALPKVSCAGEDPSPKPETTEHNSKLAKRIEKLFENSDLTLTTRVLPSSDAKRVIVEYAQWHPYALNKTPFDDFAVPQVALALTQSANGAEFAWKKLSKEFGKAMRPVVMEGMFVSDGELSESALFAFMAVASAPALIGLGGVDVKQARKQLDEFVANVDKAGMKKEDLIKSFGEILTALESRDQALKGPEHAVARQSNKDAIELYGLIKKAVERGKDDDIRALVVNSERRFHAVPGLLSSGATVVGAEPNRESHVRALSALQADSLDTALSSVTGPALPRAAFDEFVVRARNEAHVKRAASSPPSSEGPAVSMVVIGAAHDLSESVKQWNAAHPNDQILLVRAAAVKFGQ